MAETIRVWDTLLQAMNAGVGRALVWRKTFCAGAAVLDVLPDDDGELDISIDGRWFTDIQSVSSMLPLAYPRPDIRVRKGRLLVLFCFDTNPVLSVSPIFEPLDTDLSPPPPPAVDFVYRKKLDVGCTVVDVSPDDDGEIDMTINDVRLTCVYDIQELLPIGSPNRIHLHKGKVMTLIPTTPNADKPPAWAAITSLRAYARHLLETPGAHETYNAYCSEFGILPLYTLGPEFGKAIMPPLPSDSPVVMRLPNNEIMEYSVALALLEITNDPNVVGIANVRLPDFGRGGVAVLTRFCDDNGVIPSFFTEGDSPRIISLPSLTPWRADDADINANFMRVPVSRVHAVGTLLTPQLAAWYRSFLALRDSETWVKLPVDVPPQTPLRNVMFNGSVLNWNTQGGYQFTKSLGFAGDRDGILLRKHVQVAPRGAPASTQKLTFFTAPG